MNKKPVVLVIRDGWGEHPGGDAEAKVSGNAVILAQTPVHDALYKSYPHGVLSASGTDVGLPPGQMGNSEVGHLNLGAGRVVYQGLTRINKAIEEGDFSKNKALVDGFSQAKKARLHLVGLVSDGGVHSHIDHLEEICRSAQDAGVSEIMIHAITDGRDTSPTGGVGYLKQLEAKLEALQIGSASIATVIGRYYAMDRDQRWERNQIAWDAIVNGLGEKCDSLPSEALAQSYSDGKTDEFVTPLIFGSEEGPRIKDGDVVFFYNFRADRVRQLSEAFLNGEKFKGFDAAPFPKIKYLTMTQYDATYKCSVLFPPIELEKTLGEVVSAAGKNQLRIAETEKYPHVTYFFNGGVETPNAGEDRHIVASPKVATYDLQPEMSAEEVTETILEKLPSYDLVIINFANPDMVGHTGSVEAAIKAVEKIDNSVGKVVDKVKELGGKLLITSDHGNCEQMVKPDGSPHTAHTTFLVSSIYVAPDSDQVKVQDGILGDIAPTLLSMLEVSQPKEMTGKSLLTFL